jgi:hypothetical protein
MCSESLLALADVPMVRKGYLRIGNGTSGGVWTMLERRRKVCV